VLGSPPNAPKVGVLLDNSNVALTIDRDEFPYHALLIRGTAHIETVEGVTPEYEACAERYFGEEQGREWVENVRQMFTQMTRISVRPEWVTQVMTPYTCVYIDTGEHRELVDTGVGDLGAHVAQVFPVSTTRRPSRACCPKT